MHGSGAERESVCVQVVMRSNLDMGNLYILAAVSCPICDSSCSLCLASTLNFFEIKLLYISFEPTSLAGCKRTWNTYYVKYMYLFVIFSPSVLLFEAVEEEE